MWASFVKKAQFGARLAYDTVSEHLTGREASFDPQPGPILFGSDRSARSLETGALKSPRASSGTLQPGDLEPDWRGHKR